MWPSVRSPRFQSVLCRAGPDRRIYRRPFQPQVDRDGERPLLERRHHVHGTLQRIPDAGRDAQHRNGGGEAFFGLRTTRSSPINHDRTRAFAMSIHQTAYYVGIILSGYAAGVVGELWGWRNAFYIFGVIGVLHGIIMAGHLRDRKHPATEPTERGGGTSRNPVSPKDSASFSRLRRHSF